MTARIADARMVVFERSGHYPFAEEEGSFGRVVADFLRRPTLDQIFIR